LVRIVK